MRWTRRSLLAAGAASAAAASQARAYPPDAAMWEVRAGSAEAYLFGDGGPLRAPWRSPRFDAALAGSQAFWKETPEASAPGLFLAKGIDPARPLSTWLTPQDETRVAAAAQTVGLTSAALERFRPWLASVVLDSSFRSHFGFKQENGPEHALVAAAKAAAKPIRSEFAEVAEVVDYFAGFSKAAEVGALMRAVEDVEAGPDDAQRDVDAWAAGDQGPATKKVIGLSRAYPEYYQAILVARNRRWPARFRSMLDGGGTTFVLVGGDHLVGPDSVQTQLVAAGMRVRRV
jgi:uncharacterized protein